MTKYPVKKLPSTLQMEALISKMGRQNEYTEQQSQLQCQLFEVIQYLSVSKSIVILRGYAHLVADSLE